MSDETTLAQEMEARGLTDTELGARVGVSADTMRNYRTGKTSPKAPCAVRIAEQLGVTVGHLFSEGER